jgi:hypothetical protein
MNVRVATDPVIETQSYAWALREAFLGAASRAPFFANFTLRRTKELPIEPVTLPTLGAYFLDEVMAPEGDGNAGELVFVATARIGFSVIVINNDPEAAEATLDRAFMALMNAIWRDAYVTNLIDTHDPHRGEGSPLNARFESVPRQLRRPVISGTIGSKNETPIAELQYEISLLHRWDFGPTIVDEFEEMWLTTAYPPGLTEEEREAVQQVRQQVRLRQNPRS